MLVQNMGLAQATPLAQPKRKAVAGQNNFAKSPAASAQPRFGFGLTALVVVGAVAYLVGKFGGKKK